MIRLIPAIVAGLLLTACDSKPDESTQDVAQPEKLAELDPAKGIDWFDGSVDEAFAAAKESGKPLYLYWGAVWCPPCHAIAATIFKSPEFIERSRLFVPVYLDGDTANAQAYGERFGVRGYPTMVVFNPDGVELTRIPGGIDIQAYANILDVTLNNSSSTSDLVTALMDGDVALTASDCTLLAYNSWGQDTQILEEYDDAEAFLSMHSACPGDLTTQRSILYMSWLDAMLNDEDEDEADSDERVLLSAAQVADARRAVQAVLDDPVLVKANIFSVLFSGPRYVAELTDPDSEERELLIRSFHRVFDELASDESVYKRERIYTLIGKIRFERMDDEEAEISDQLKLEIREMTAWADESTPSVYERQPIINALANVLTEAGMDDVAKPLLLAELERSRQPYYFMVDIADIEERAGNSELAIEWLRKAHEATRGPATRFQWGYYYLNGLMEMAPDDMQRIHDTTVGLIAELQQSGGFYQRPKAQLGRLEKSLLTWGEEHGGEATLDEIRDSVRAVCMAAPSNDDSHNTCESFLESV